MIFAIDPGTTESAVVVWDGTILDAYKKKNEFILNEMSAYAPGCLYVAIEMVASYGMPVGKEVFETVRWIGRFQQHAISKFQSTGLIYRKEVKLYLCNSLKAKDANIRQALIDKIGIIGTKKAPGPLYKIKENGGGDIWSALAIAITCYKKF